MRHAPAHPHPRRSQTWRIPLPDFTLTSHGVRARLLVVESSAESAQSALAIAVLACQDSATGAFVGLLLRRRIDGEIGLRWPHSVPLNWMTRRPSPLSSWLSSKTVFSWMDNTAGQQHPQVRSRPCRAWASATIARDGGSDCHTRADLGLLVARSLSTCLLPFASFIPRPHLEHRFLSLFTLTDLTPTPVLLCFSSRVLMRGARDSCDPPPSLLFFALVSYACPVPWSRLTVNV
ncbi:hypothetical protein TRAPUB_2586 [Trametes pubescens]|uniref:Uncharacterized protein n=1 Tax=Trametes pubescens TaxID=154538 RepID=A0A1M2VFX5_TRAPU|nr:hypothetical protein TRAPUB_2586 [Trametes pubescens]